MTKRTALPDRPEPARLTRTASGRYPAYRTPDGRFTLTRNRPTADVTYEDSGFDLVDTARANILGHAHTNTARVFEVADALILVDKVLRAEWLYRVQRYLDAQRRKDGLPTEAEAATAAARRERMEIRPAVRS